MSGFYDQEKLDRAQTRVRASATPAQLRIMDEVSLAVQAESTRLDSQFAEESKLREWAINLCGIPLDISELEEFRDFCKTQRPGMFYFRAKRGSSVSLVKTSFNTIDRTDNYVKVLENAVIDMTNNSQFTALSFFGLMKLAFKRLLMRTK